jgi:hypothetical protein
MRRVFTQGPAPRYERLVLARRSKRYLYHPECSPDGSEEDYVSTRKSCCHACHGPLHRDPVKSKGD